jgi:hypothetical protein
MKKLLVLILAVSVFQACKKKDETAPGKGNLVMLKVDYLTHKFEGGKVFDLPAVNDDTIPVHVIYQSPGDFGNITLLFGPANDTIFDGAIIWMGSGEMRYPVMQPANAFSFGGASVAPPAHGDIKYINKLMQQNVNTPADADDIWAAIKKLTITKDFMDGHAKAGLFLYTPSVGIGNPEEWNYYWILYRNAPQPD